MICRITRELNEDVEKYIQDVILSTKNAEYCYEFAYHCKTCDVKKLQKVVLSLKNAELCYQFARDIKGADVKSLGKVVLESRDPELCASFAEYVDGANQKLFQKAAKIIIKEQNAKEKAEEKRLKQQ